MGFHTPRTGGPIFVVGHPRSGTTLIQSILAAASDVGSGPETHFFTYVDEDSVKRLQAADLGHSRPGPTLESPSEQFFVRVSRKPGIELSDAERARVSTVVGDAWDQPAIVLDALMRTITDRSGACDRWLEKTPRHVFAIPRILELFPDATIVNVVRDPRDVVVSAERFKNLARGADRLEFSVVRAGVWRRAVSAEGLTDDRVTTVRYEDLIDRPARVTAALCRHSGIRDPPQALLARRSATLESIVVAGEEGRKGLNRSNMLVDRTGQWVGQLTDEEHSAVVSLCDAEMREYGYDR